MAIDIQSFQDLALAKINEVGSDITLKVPNGTTYDFNEGKTVTTYDDTPMKGDINSFDSERIVGSVESTDIEIMIPFITEIKQNYLIDIGGVVYKVFNPNPTVKQNLIIYYMVHCKK